MVSLASSQSTSILQESGELASNSLEVGVTTDVLLLDEDVGHSALVGDLLESILDRGAVIWKKQARISITAAKAKRTGREACASQNQDIEISSMRSRGTVSSSAFDNQKVLYNPSPRKTFPLSDHGSQKKKPNQQ